VRQLYFTKRFNKDTPKKVITNTAKIITIGIQSGLVTHHHDQSITPTNLSTKNTTNNVPVNDNPCDLLCDIIYIVLIIDT
jgi:hypothetical protein